MFASKSIALLERDLADKEYAIKALQERVQELTAVLESLRSANEETDEMRALAKRREECEMRPQDIPIEEGMDTIVRLESTLKLVEQRNVLLRKELEARERCIKNYQKALASKKKEHENIINITGFTPERALEHDAELNRQKAAKIREVETEMRRELATAELIIRKKGDLVANLSKELESSKNKEFELCKIYNDIRVTDRDCAVLKASLEELVADTKKVDGAMTVVQNRRDVVAVSSLQSDKEFLRSELDRHRQERRWQDEVLKAQEYRLRQLQARLDVVMNAIQDMRIERELERRVSRSTVIPASNGDADDLDRILPPNETVAVELYELLHRDNEAMRSVSDRKYILVTEKECTIQAQEAKLNGLMYQMQMTIKQEEQARLNKGIEQQEARELLCQQHEDFRNELGRLIIENTRLKTLVSSRKSA